MKKKILELDAGHHLMGYQKRSLMTMFLDAAENYKVVGRGRRAPAWTKIDFDLARTMEPDEFFAVYGREWAEAALTDPNMRFLQEAHDLVYEGGFVGKHMEDELASTLRDDLEILARLEAGQNIYADPRLRANLERLFNETGFSLEYHLRRIKGGKFQMESNAQIVTLSETDLMKELKLLGHTPDTAKEALASGAMKRSALSEAAFNTLSSIPTADAALLGELSRSTAREVENAILMAASLTEKSATEALVADKIMKRIDRLLRQVSTVDGLLQRSSIENVRSILEGSDTKSLLKRVLPQAEHPKLDAILDMVNAVELQRNANPVVRRAIRESRGLRADIVFDTEGIQNAVRESLEEARTMLADETLQEFARPIAGFNRLTEIFNELYGLAPDPRSGMTRNLWLSGDALDDTIGLMKEAEHLARENGWDEIGQVFAEAVFAGGEVPTAATRDFVPIVSFGLGGKQVEGKLIQSDVGAFMEQTVGTMLAMQTPIALQGFTEGFRTVLRWWKSMATVARPTFHVRNAMSAAWNNSMINVRLQDYAFTARHLPELRKAFARTNDWVAAAREMSDQTASYYFEQAALAGLFDSTFSRREILNKMAKETKVSMMRRANPLGLEGPLVRAGGEAMSGIEDFMRLAAFIRHMDDPAKTAGSEFAVAASRDFANDMVNMVHFDYANLTKMEEKIKDYVPFFVWTRRNLPLQMRALVEQPRMIARYNHLMQVGNDMSSSENDGPRRYGGQSYIGTDMYLNEDTPFWAQLILDPDLPVKDLFEIEKPWSLMSYVNLAAGMLGPQFQEPIKMIGQEDYEVTAPTGWATVIRQMQRIIPGGQNGSTAPRINNKVASILRLAWPPASEFLTGLEQDPVRMQQLGIVDGDIGSRLRAAGIDLIGPGLGLGTKTPANDYSVYQSSIMNNDILTNLRKQGIITQEVDDLYEAWAKQNR